MEYSGGVKSVTDGILDIFGGCVIGVGHADIKTTAIYANVVGAEEQDIAARMWA